MRNEVYSVKPLACHPCSIILLIIISLYQILCSSFCIMDLCVLGGDILSWNLSCSQNKKHCSSFIFYYILHCVLTYLTVQDDYQLVRDSISGYIYDSSPVDFTSDMGIRFILHPSVLKVSHPPKFASWIANGIASGLDSLFLNRFESHRAEYWRTLYSTTVSS